MKRKKVKQWTPLLALRKIRRVLGNPAHWTQRADARDQWGHPCPVRSPEARCWCLSGAIDRVGPPPPPFHRERWRHDAARALDRAASKRYLLRSFVAVNDASDHATMMALLDQVIADLERGGAP